jgi:hypothetical protein
MNVEVITREDLQDFRRQLINDIKELLINKPVATKDWLRSNEVRKLLNISAGTLQSFRINGTLQSSKIGGIHFYKYSDINKLLNDNTNSITCK